MNSRNLIILFSLQLLALFGVQGQTWREFLDKSWKASCNGTSNKGTVVVSQDSAIVLGRLALESARNSFGDHDSSSGIILNMLGDCYYRNGDFASADSLWQEALSINRETLGDAHPETDGSLFRLGILHSDSGDLDSAPTEVREIMSIRDFREKDCDSLQCRRLRDLAFVYDRFLRFKESEKVFEDVVRFWEVCHQCRPWYVVRVLMGLAENASKVIGVNVRQDITSQNSAIVLGNKALRIAEDYYGKSDPSVGFVLNRLGDYYSRKGLGAITDSLWARALEINSKLPEENIEYQGSIDRMGGVYAREGHYSAAESLLVKAVYLRKRTQGPEQQEVATMLTNLARFYRRIGRFHEAESLLTDALYIRRKTLTPDHVDIAQTLEQMAAVDRDLGHYREAEVKLLRAVSMKERLYGSNQGTTIDGFQSIADLYLVWGRRDEAIVMLRKVLSVRELFDGPASPAVAFTLVDLADVIQENGGLAEAEGMALRALHIMEESQGKNSPDISSVCTTLAELYHKQKRFHEAESLFVRALTLRQSVYGEKNFRVASNMVNLADLYVHQNRDVEADSLFRLAISTGDQFGTAELPYLADCLEPYAALLHRQGESSQALTIISRAFEIRLRSFANGVEVMSERDALQFARQLEGTRNLYLSIYFDLPSSNSAAKKKAAEVLLSTKGTVSQELLERERLNRHPHDSQSRALVDSLRDVHVRLSRLYVEGTGRDISDTYLERYRSASLLKLRLEQALARLGSVNASSDWAGAITLDSLIASIPSGCTLIDYLRFNRSESSAGSEKANYVVLAVC